MLEEISYGCLGINTTLAGNLLASLPLILAGSEAQKKTYLGRLLEKPSFAAYCCSEPDAGADVAGMKTRFREDGGGYVLIGQKRLINYWGLSDFYTVFARLE